MRLSPNCATITIGTRSSNYKNRSKVRRHNDPESQNALDSDLEIDDLLRDWHKLVQRDVTHTDIKLKCF